MSDPSDHRYDTSSYVKLNSDSPRADGELEAVRKLLIAERERSTKLFVQVMRARDYLNRTEDASGGVSHLNAGIADYEAKRD